ncbi:potassium voltage-gated channel subfamily H member 4, partial [Pelobates cultripes]
DLFWCLLDIIPIKNEKGEVVLFLFSFKDITEQRMRTQLNEKQKSCRTGTSYFTGARRQRRTMLCQLTGQVTERSKRDIKLNSNLLNSSRPTLPEYKVASVQKPRFILLHYSIFKALWDWLILLATFYLAVTVPYNVCFTGHDDNVSAARSTIVSDIVVEMLFILATSRDRTGAANSTPLTEAESIAYKGHVTGKRRAKALGECGFRRSLPSYERDGGQLTEGTGSQPLTLTAYSI